MKDCKYCVPLVLAVWGAAAGTSALAQSENTGALNETVVTATRTERPLTDLVADVTVIDRAQIERSGATGVSDVLARMPGIEFARNGGIGSTTSVYIRGAETRFTAVFIDGVRVDSQSTGGASWEAIPLAQIDRIEIVRGPASAVYGSDALGGVVQIFTRKGRGPLAPYAGVALGTYGTRKWETGFSGASGAVDYALGVAREASSGFNARPLAGYNADDDGYSIESLSGRLGWQLNEAHRLEATALSSNGDAQYDSTNRAPGSTYDDHALHMLQTRGLNWRARWSDTYSTQFGVTESRDQYETRPAGRASTYLTMTRLNGYLWQNEWRHDAHKFTAALERKVDYLENGLTINPATAIVRDRFQDGLALGYGWTGLRHSVQFNARHDQDSEFGPQDTGSLAYGYAFAPGWRATASVGSAFRVPTLFQRFSTYGVSTLQPESSVNQELGLRYAQGTTQWDITTYRSRVSNLITFSSPGPCTSTVGCYANTAEAEYAGVTLSARGRWAELNVQGSLDVQDPRDKITGNLLPRRASHHASFLADTYRGAWQIGGGVQLSGARYDDAGNTVVLPGYALFNVYTSTRLGRDWTLLARIDNLTDSSYQLASGYAIAGRSLYVGLRWEPARQGG
jgi:vitamin B12 transporter